MAFEDMNIEDIFLMMSMKEENLKQAHQAYAEFYKRYSKYLYAIVTKTCSIYKNTYGSTLEESVFSNTILKVYEKSESFLILDEFKTEKQKDRRLKAWLGKIASNELFKLLRGYKIDNQNVIFNSDLLLTKDDLIEISTEEKKISINRKILDYALNSLKEREKQILLTYYAFQEDGKNMQSSVLDEICDLYNTTRANIRQIKKRSIERIEKYFSEYQKKQ